MTADDRRLGRLYLGLTARERAQILARAAVDRGPCDHRVLASMPAEQEAEFERLLALVKGVRRVIVPRVAVLDSETEVLKLRHALLNALAAWAADRAQLVSALCRCARQPIPENEHRRLVEEAREEYVPLVAAAEVAALRRGADLAPMEAELRRLVDAGELRSRGRGRRIEIHQGALYDWLGEPVPPLPGWPVAFEVVPEEQWESMKGRAELLQGLLADLPNGPSPPSHLFPVPLQLDGEPQNGANSSDMDTVARLEAAVLREGIRSDWLELLALKTVLAEARAEFGSEDVAPAGTAEYLARIRTTLEALHRESSWFSEPFDLPEPSEAAIESLREQVQGEDTPGL